ncbi:hypothetical protein [Sphingomonas sp. SORGH_AS_0879]|uniref:hypothetical protein n=1 Tax=Sphingomonas sp. SORGH_AS_0879 TaxID=3041790 RepID=UPI002783471E|nr:hypothetical protein [Sphingomonas sp. SORGH_AS_0879]MDQ1229297.1 hypothetical protein [Sphingomonas sp. SORGH_AS_0879]
MDRTIRMVPMRGFTAAIAQDRAAPQAGQVGGIAVGFDGVGDEAIVSLSLRHSDGTMLVASLSVAGVNRLLGLVADAMSAPDPRAVRGTLQ